ncbi:MAG: glycosyltransferase family 1 protein, partial [Acidimicrobiia bacterium]|nr:glycosyltransferase family 1 protein [Acidimicrobiia bacterium]
MTVATATVDLDVIRVASVPSDHVYVRHLAPPTGMGGVVRLQDPTPAGVPPAGAPWYPPSILDTGWVSRHASTFDVAHLHFGFDAKSPHELEGFVAELRHHHKPFV